MNQLGIAQTLVNTLFMAVVGAAALALGLAFGLGGRDTASEIVRNWYRRGQEAAPRIQQAAGTAADMATDATASMTQEPGNAATYGRRRGDDLAFGGGDD